MRPEDCLHAVPDGCNDGPWSIRESPTIIKLTEGSLGLRREYMVENVLPTEAQQALCFPKSPKEKCQLRNPTGKNNHLWITHQSYPKKENSSTVSLHHLPDLSQR